MISVLHEDHLDPLSRPKGESLSEVSHALMQQRVRWKFTSLFFDNPIHYIVMDA